MTTSKSISADAVIEDATNHSSEGWFQKLSYETQKGRDLRIDLMRGIVMLMLVVVHFEVFSAFNFIAWERLGILTSAEGFVLFSGFILGTIQRKQANKEIPERESYNKLWARSWQIYRVNISVVVVILLLSILPFMDLSVIQTFKNWGNGEIYPLFPRLDSDWNRILLNILLLKHSPHQIQILGLYTLLLALSPLLFAALRRGHIKTVLFIITLLYLYQITYPGRPTKAQFEYAFPILAWQFIFFGSMIAGYYQQELGAFLQRYRIIIRPLFLAAALVFIFFAWNAPNTAFPEWSRFDYLSAKEFYELHNKWFSKKNLGILRILNNIVFWVSFYWLISSLWKPVNALVGWLLIPIGQHSLYVFVMHLPLIYFFDLVFDYSNYRPLFNNDIIVANTLIHASAIFSLWLMVKNRFLFKLIPN